MTRTVRKLKPAIQPFVILAALTFSFARWGGLRVWDAVSVSAAILGVRRNAAEGKPA